MAARGRTSAGSRIASQELSSSRESGQRSYGSQGSNVTDNVPNQELRIISGESNQRSYGPHRSNVMDNVADQVCARCLLISTVIVSPVRMYSGGGGDTMV